MLVLSLRRWTGYRRLVQIIHSLHNAQAVLLAEHQIQNKNIRLQRGNLTDGLLPVGGGTNHLEATAVL